MITLAHKPAIKISLFKIKLVLNQSVQIVILHVRVVQGNWIHNVHHVQVTCTSMKLRTPVKVIWKQDSFKIKLNKSFLHVIRVAIHVMVLMRIIVCLAQIVCFTIQLKDSVNLLAQQDTMPIYQRMNVCNVILPAWLALEAAQTIVLCVKHPYSINHQHFLVFHLATWINILTLKTVHNFVEIAIHHVFPVLTNYPVINVQDPSY